MANETIGGSPVANGGDDPAARRLADQFLASLNHDIRTPLSGIMGMADLLLETELTGEQQEYVQTTRLCADQLLEMLNSALEYAALTSGEFRIEREEFHLPESLRATAAEFAPKAEAKDLEFLCHLDPRLPEHVIGDAARLRQILSPLLSNALKFTPHGRVEVAATAGKSTEGVVLRVRVKDTGIGIPADKLGAIFAHFRQLESGLSRSHAGIGLGLSVAKWICELLGGGISVESQIGVGTSFTVTVPLALPEEAAPAAASRSGKGTGSGDSRYRILVVEDNEVARRIVTHILSRADFDVACATGGAEGIAAASEARFDLILMDLQMPGVNGLDAAGAIRRLPDYARTPILALTANFSEEFKKICHEAGFQDYLAKPIQRDDLLRAIQQFLKPR